MAPSPPNLSATLLSKKTQKSTINPHSSTRDKPWKIAMKCYWFCSTIWESFLGEVRWYLSLSQGFQSYECKFFFFLILFFNVVKFSRIEILQIGFVVLWTKNMDQNLLFSLHCPFFQALFALESVLIQKKSLLTTCGEICLQVQAAPFMAQMLSITVSRVLNTKAKQHSTASERLH